MDKLDVLERLEEYESIESRLVDLSTLDFTVDGVRIEDDEVVVERDVQNNLFSMLGVPQGYAKKIPWQLLYPHMNYFVQKVTGGISSNEATPLTVMLKDNHLIGAVPGDYQMIKLSGCLDIIEDVLGEVTEYSVNCLDVTYNSLTAFSVVQTEPKVGDFIRWGVNILNSPTAIYSTEVSLFAERLICANGAVMTDTLTRFRRKWDSNITTREWFKRSIGKAWENKQLLGDMFNNTVDIAIANQITSLPQILKAVHIPDRMIPDIMKQVEDGVITTLYDLIQCITYYANHSNIRSEMTRRSLMKLGGNLVSLESCPTCNSLVDHISHNGEQYQNN